MNKHIGKLFLSAILFLFSVSSAQTFLTGNPEDLAKFSSNVTRVEISYNHGFMLTDYNQVNPLKTDKFKTNNFSEINYLSEYCDLLVNDFNSGKAFITFPGVKGKTNRVDVSFSYTHEAFFINAAFKPEESYFAEIVIFNKKNSKQTNAYSGMMSHFTHDKQGNLTVMFFPIVAKLLSE